MKETLKEGIHFKKQFTVTQSKTVPSLYPESPEFMAMPEVFATGYLVGLLEWACILAIKPHINWPIEQTLGTDINITHQKASLIGCKINVEVELTEVIEKKLIFKVTAYDGKDIISKGTHQRYIITKSEFEKKNNIK